MLFIHSLLKLKPAALLFLTIFLVDKSFGQAGTLDPSFGNGGKVVTTFSSAADYIYSVAIQTDKKLVVGGRINLGTSGQPYDFGLVRYLENGSLDLSFGLNGRVVTDFFSKDDICYAVGIQPDQKIIAVGDADDAVAGVPHVIVLARYDTTGTIDSSFGTNGLIRIDYGFGQNFARALSILPDGKIFIAGTAIATSNPTAEDFALIKLKTNGDFDSSFGSNGKVLIDFNARGDYANSLVVQADGKIVLGGYTVGSSNTKDFGLVRVNNDGSVDSTFGINGRTTIDFQSSEDICNSIALQSDGKIVAVGYTGAAGNFSLCRFSINGNLDSTFATNGKRITLTNTDYVQSNSAVVQPDDKIVVAGNDMNSNFHRTFRVVRYKKDGSLDSTFGSFGKVFTDFGNFSYPHSTLIQPDGKIVVAGNGTLNSETGFALARYNNNLNSLPVKLTFFAANRNNKTVVLSWQTNAETNNKMFIVERSVSVENNGKGFEEIGTVKSKENDAQLNLYDFTDEHPFNTKNFYRLKQVDYDGAVTYSKIVSIDFGTVPSYKIYPTPVKDVLHIFNLSGFAKMSILSPNGTLIDKKEAHNNSYEWDVRSLPSGVYYLQIEENKRLTTLKIVKQ